MKIHGRQKCHFWLVDEHAMAHLAVVGEQKKVGRCYLFEACEPMASLHPFRAVYKSDVKAWLQKVPKRSQIPHQ